ncbi:hypothetical protein [Sphingomonas sp. RT2P30]|uniref:hypothetical protein n=1 Tax=Parasphingomonas halimpatiens TaxID=3096162 RepID=UPI002FC9BCAB
MSKRHEESDAVATIAAAIRATAPDEAPSGIVYNPLFHTLDDASFASAAPASVSLGELRQILWELAQGALHGPAPVALPALDRAVGKAAWSGVVPLALVDYRFEAVTPAALEHYRVGIRKGDTLDLGEIDRAKLLEARRVTFCRPLIETVPDGAALTFSFAHAWHATNSGADPVEIVLDADDGHGPRSLPAGATAHVSYASAGDKRITTTLRFADGHERTTLATLHVKALALPPPDWSREMLGYHGRVAAIGTMKVYYAPGRQHIARPLFMWTGFDTGATMLGGESLIGQWSATAEDFLADPDIAALLEAARSKAGYDIVIIEFADTGKPIEANAAMVAASIHFINGLARQRAPGAILTGSMGGLVARLALLDIELKERSGGSPHHIGKAIFFDSPFTGAVIPMAVQCALDYFAGTDEGARERRDKYLDAASARQMLVQKYAAGWHHTHVPKPDRAFGALQSLFHTLGDWPQKTECFAATSGSSKGVGQRNDAGKPLNPGDEMLFVKRGDGGSWKADARFWAMPKSPPSEPAGFKILHAGRVLWDPKSAMVRNTQPWDSCPGGWYDAVRQFKERGSWTDSDLKTSNTCFVPTLSALAIPMQTGDLYREPKPEPGKPFKAVYLSPENTQHCKLTPGVTGWIKEMLDIPKG